MSGSARVKRLAAAMALFWLGLAAPPSLAQETRAPLGLDRFLEVTRRADFDTYARQQSAVRDAAAFAEMRDYILKFYSGVSSTHTFYDSGSVVDCVPLRQQPGLRGAAPARPIAAATAARARVGQRGASTGEPPRAQGPTRTIDLTLKPTQKDRFGNVRYCRAGTVPLRRLTLDEMTRFPTLGAFLRRGKAGEGLVEPRQLPDDAAVHYYARGVQYVDNLGGDGWLNVWSPSVASSQMSLSQLWVVGEGDKPKQTVEAGWQVYPDSWNTSQAALFIFYTTNDYKDGCYNKECDGFVQVANNVYLGKGFTNYSSTNGTQWGFNLQWKRSAAGDWWLFYKGPGNYIAVGYYKKSLFGSGYLATRANKIAFGGEDTGSKSAKQMGSGSFAANGWAKAAFQKSIFYIDTTGVSQWNSLTKFESDTSCYTADVHNIYGNWGTYLYFGGPSCH